MATFKVVLGSPQNPKQFYRITPDATNRSTRGSWRRENTAFIKRVSLILLFRLIFFIVVGYNRSRSMAMVLCASWQIRVIFLASFSSRMGLEKLVRTTYSMVTSWWTWFFVNTVFISSSGPLFVFSRSLVSFPSLILFLLSSVCWFESFRVGSVPYAQGDSCSMALFSSNFVVFYVTYF